jgi:hypothetical protein
MGSYNAGVTNWRLAMSFYATRGKISPMLRSLLSKWAELSDSRSKSTYAILLCNFLFPASSVSIVSGYGLDDRPIEVRSPAEAKGFFL